MTRKEAFETFHKKRMHLQLAMPGSHGFHKDYAYSDAQVAWNAWNAACDWQKAQDAALIYTKGDKRYHPWGEHYEEDVREMCAGEIMCS